MLENELPLGGETNMKEYDDQTLWEIVHSTKQFKEKSIYDLLTAYIKQLKINADHEFQNQFL